MKFRKKPVVIDAMRWTGDNLDEVATFIGGASNVYRKYSSLRIRTLEGVLECKRGDWLIKGVKGEFYPCRPDIFEETYEPITQEST